MQSLFTRTELTCLQGQMFNARQLTCSYSRDDVCYYSARFCSCDICVNVCMYIAPNVTTHNTHPMFCTPLSTAGRNICHDSLVLSSCFFFFNVSFAGYLSWVAGCNLLARRVCRDDNLKGRN